VVILWDSARNRIAIKAAPKGDKNSFTATFTSHNNSATFSSKSFLRHIGRSAAKREILATTWNAKEKMFEVTLPLQYLASGSDAGKRKHRVI
jgi:hypothetical protein